MHGYCNKFNIKVVAIFTPSGRSSRATHKHPQPTVGQATISELSGQNTLFIWCP